MILTKGKNLSQCHVIHGKSHVDWPGIEDETPRREAGDWPPEPVESRSSWKLFIKIRFLPPRKHTASRLQTPEGYNGSLLWESHDILRQSEREWSSGGLVTDAWGVRLLGRETCHTV